MSPQIDWDGDLWELVVNLIPPSRHQWSGDGRHAGQERLETLLGSFGIPSSYFFRLLGRKQPPTHGPTVILQSHPSRYQGFIQSQENVNIERSSSLEPQLTKNSFRRGCWIWRHRSCLLLLLLLIHIETFRARRLRRWVGVSSASSPGATAR